MKCNGGRQSGGWRWSSRSWPGITSVQEAARKHGLTVANIEDWKNKFLMGAENALRSRPRDEEEAFKDEQIKKLQRKVGELVLDIDILKEMKGHPFAPKTFDE